MLSRSNRLNVSPASGSSAILIALVLLVSAPDQLRASSTNLALASSVVEAKEALLATHGETEAARIERGVDQVARLWRPGDGNGEAFVRFVEAEFVPQGPELEATFLRFEFATERIGGYFTSLVRDLRRGVDLEIGPLLPLDRRLAAFDPAAHLSDDLFASKIAFVALLNFPLTTLEERMSLGEGWSREEWAAARLTEQFSSRVPAGVNQAISQAFAAADSYISDYNIYMHHLLTEDGRRIFPEGLRLISHWGLRDELKARYTDPDGLEQQQMIQQVMERIVRQEIPVAVINNPLLDWEPAGNEVMASSVRDAEPPASAAMRPSSAREDDERYRHWLSIYQAIRQADTHHPDNPTLIDRRFNVDREIPETEVEALFKSILTSPLSARVAAVIQTRLVRDLEPFDIWYAGFKPRGGYTEADLDARTRRRYPTAGDYGADIPRLLEGLGFSEDRARFLAQRIVVEPSRGAGHAFGAARRDDSAHLRTRVGESGMDYKGYNIAVHEMGHNVEQPTPASPRRWRLSSSSGIWSCWVSPATRPGPRTSRRWRPSGPPGRSPASPWWTWRCGAGSTTIPAPPR